MSDREESVPGKAVFYFHSGTGNSLRVCAWMADAWRAAGVSVRTGSIEAARPVVELRRAGASLVGLVMPTHGFTAPWPALRFALLLPRGHGTEAVVVATRGAVRIGSFILPGAEGTATYLVSLILALKGYRVRGAMGIDMPANWIALHPGLSDAAVEAIRARGRAETERFCRAVLSGGTRFTGWVPLLIGLLFCQVSAVYLLLGRLVLAKLFFYAETCNGCGVCAENCPNDAIRMLGRSNPRPYWTIHCVSCMRCMAYCPSRAVEASQPLCVAAFLVAGLVPAGWLLRWLALRCPVLAFLRAVPGWIVFTAVLVAVLALFYPVLHVLLRLRWVNRLFTYTTPTHYYRRYHEPGTRLEDLEA